MLLPCQQSVRCPGETDPIFGFDFPIANFSSERPDAEIFVAVNYGWDNNAPVLGQVYDTPGCVSWCISTESQDEADLCAARQQILCLEDQPPDVPPSVDGSSNPELPTTPTTPGSPTTPPSTPTLFHNSEQTCSASCPDGQVFTETVAAGSVIARSQVLADEIAHSTACSRVQAKVICTTALNGFACADPFFENPEYSFTFTAISSNPPITWSLAGGSLPPQLVLESNGLLHGTPDTEGHYSFTVRATNSVGKFADKACTFEVLGLDITQKALPSAKVDHPYSYTLPSQTAVSLFISDGSLPNGLSMSSSGVISGTPDTVVNSSFTVTVQDEFLNRCEYDLTLKITGPKFTNAQPPDGTVCAPPYSFTFTAVGIGTVTFSGSVPPGLTLNSATGVASGNLTSKGTQTFSIIATDSAGNTNTKTWTITVAASAVNDPNGHPLATSAQDMIWANNIIQDPGCTVSGPMAGANGSITLKGAFQPGSGLYTAELDANSWIAHCASKSNYNLTATATWAFTQETNPPNGNQSFAYLDIVFCGVSLVFNNHVTGPGTSGPVSCPVLASQSLLAMVLKANGGLPTTSGLVVTITITPAAQP